MSRQFSARTRRVLTRKESVSSLDLKAAPEVKQVDSITFDTSPVDFGVVVSGMLERRELELDVHFATRVNLKIRGDVQFSAALKQVEVNDPGAAGTLAFRDPLLVNEYVPPLDIVSGPDDIFFDVTESQSVEEMRPRLMSSQIETPQGKRVAYSFQTPSFQQPPTNSTSSLERKDFNESGSDMVFGDVQFEQMPNVFPGNDIYYIEVSFDAPDTIYRTYNATLTVSFDDVEVDIPLTAQTGNISLVLENTTAPAIHLGESAFLSLRITNLGNRTAQVSFATQTPKNGIIVPAQSWSIPANQQMSVSLQVQTQMIYFYNGLVTLRLSWEGRFDTNSTGTRPLQAALSLTMRPPQVFIQTSINALQGSDASFGVTIYSKGPTTTFYFRAQGLPDGVTMQQTPVVVGSGQTITTHLTLVVSEHATVNNTNEPVVPFTVLYSAYGGSIQDKQSVDLSIENAFRIQAQQQTLWCWAAVTASVFDYYGGTIRQCELANQFIDTPSNVNCCNSPVHPLFCNQANSTPDALDSLGLLASEVGGPLSLPEIIIQIDLNRPVVVRIEWADSDTAHAIVITGYVTTNAGDTLLIVEDPNGASQTLLGIATLLFNYRDSGSWDDSYLTKPPS